MKDWNWQKEAQERYITANEHGYEHDAQLSIAAALIALAERRPQFVQVGEVRINTQAIFRVSHYTDEDGMVVTVMTEGGAAYSFEGPDATAFLAWHEQHADVVRLDSTGPGQQCEEAE